MAGLMMFYSWTSFRQMKGSLPDYLREITGIVERSFPAQFGNDATWVDVFVVGLGADGTAQAFMVATHDEHPGIGKFEVFDIEGACATPVAPGFEAVYGQAQQDGAGIDDVALRVAELQRNAPTPLMMPVAPGGATPAVTAGGVYLQLTTVAADGISTRILKRWPEDVVGRKIGEAA
jgi:hypothetical protein